MVKKYSSKRYRNKRHYRWDIPRSRLFQKTKWRKVSSSELLAGSFVALICSATLGFKFLPGLYTGQELSWTDALFTATSAICITGLIVVDTSTYFTFWGQLYLLLLIQVGGLGILTLASVIITSLGARPSLPTEAAIGERPSTLNRLPVRYLLFDIVRFSLAFELIGAIALYLIWTPHLGRADAIWPAVFHSVSAFCNAGFSINSDSLVSYSNSPPTLIVISALIVCGGLGIITMEEVYRTRFAPRKKRQNRLSVHSKIVLVGTGILLLLPPLAFVFFEWNQSLEGMGILSKISNSFFMAVTPRTAGFHTIDYASATDSTNLLTMILMSIGGAPGSLAGGMKITTFMLLGLLAWSKCNGHPMVIFAHRSIPDKTIKQATGVFVIMTSLMVFCIFVLQLSDVPRDGNNGVFVRAFEVVSAINTVGLSMGMTEQLPISGKLNLVLIMFVGRIGPLGLFAAFESRFSSSYDYRMASEDVIVG